MWKAGSRISVLFPRFCSPISGDIAEGNSHKLSRISRIPSIVQEPPVSQVISSNIISSGICWGKKIANIGIKAHPSFEYSRANPAIFTCQLSQITLLLHQPHSTMSLYFTWLNYLVYFLILRQGSPYLIIYWAFQNNLVVLTFL